MLDLSHKVKRGPTFEQLDRRNKNQERTTVMAKKTKTAPEAPAEGTETTAPAPATPKAEKGLNDRFVRVFVDGKAAPALNADGTAKRVAPQLQAIANALEAAGEAGTTRKDLIAVLEASGTLKTRQPTGRIVSYYQKDLVNFGLATRTAEQIAAPTPEV